MVIGQAVFPSTRGYAHFQFADYAKLTVIGVVIACAAWPAVTRVYAAPRWLFFRLAVLVTPHVAYLSDASTAAYLVGQAENVLAWQRTGRPLTPVAEPAAGTARR